MIRYHRRTNKTPKLYYMKINIAKALSGLDLALARISQVDRMPDEFTAAEFMVKSKLKRSTASEKLDLMVAEGILTKRKYCIAGHLTNLYRKA